MTPCEDDGSIPPDSYSFVPISELPGLNGNDTLGINNCAWGVRPQFFFLLKKNLLTFLSDVIGAVTDVGSLEAVPCNGKNGGTETQRVKVMIVDDSQQKVSIAAPLRL